MNRQHPRLAVSLALLTGIVCGSQSVSANTAVRDPIDWLGKVLLAAIQQNSFAKAITLLPTRAEARRLGLTALSSESGYAAFLAKRKRGFDKVVKKFQRKGYGNCKRLVFRRVKLGATVTRFGVTVYRSIDLFATCDGREVWIADPDMVFPLGHSWRLLEFN